MRRTDSFEFRIYIVDSGYVVIDGVSYWHKNKSRVFFEDTELEVRKTIDEIVEMVKDAKSVKVESAGVVVGIKQGGIYYVY